MPCKWCGGSRHPEDNCPTRNLVMYLQDLPPERWDARLPDMVVVMSENELLGKTEKELHDESLALTHLRKKVKSDV